MSVHSIATISSSLVINETPQGSVDGINKDFQLNNDPIQGTLQVDLNGLIQVEGISKDYTLSGKTISFFKSPRESSIIKAHYMK